MKKIAVAASTIMTVGLLAVSGANTFAANPTGTSVTTSLAQTKLSFEEMESKVKEELAQSLADGKITQEQYDQAISDIADGKMPEMFDKDRGGYGEKDRPELTEEQKAEMQTKMKERFAQLLSDGQITQEQYDQAMSDITQGKMPEMFDRGRGEFGEKDGTELTEEQKAEMQTKMKERFAQLLSDGKITQEQYDQAISDLAEGKMPEKPGRDKDESGEKNRPELTEEQKSEMLSKIKEKLPQLLADGKITQEQYDQALNDIAEGKMPEIPGIGRGGFHGNKTEGTTEA